MIGGSKALFLWKIGFLRFLDFGMMEVLLRVKRLIGKCTRKKTEALYYWKGDEVV